MDFLTSLAVICLLALSLGALCARLRLPPLLGMLIVGILLGPYVLDGISPTLLAISGELRQVALIIILMRAGLNLNLKEVKKNGVAAALMCLFPLRSRSSRTPCWAGGSWGSLIQRRRSWVALWRQFLSPSWCRACSR